MLPLYRVLPLMIAAALTFSAGAVMPARSDDAAVSDDDSSTDDIALGEIGSDEDEIAIPSGRRRGVAARSTPRLTAGPSIRFALAHRFAPDLSAELYGRGQIGAVAERWTARSSVVAGGLIVNKSFGALVWSNSIEVAQHYRDFYDRRTYDGYELTSALAGVVKLGDLPLSITPRVAESYLWATENRVQRWKTELSAAVTYKVTKQFDLILTPKLEYESYDSRPDERRDVTGYLGLGFKYEVAKGATLGAAIGYESRGSNLAQTGFTRWKLSPQISLRKEL